MAERSAGGVDRSGRWELDLRRRELRVRGVPVPLGGRAIEIVEVLAEAAGEMVTKSELMDRIWPGALVGDNTIQVHISAIRKALGADRGLLKTASGRGYRLLGGWTIRQEPAASAPSDVSAAPPTNQVLLSVLPVAGTDLIGRAISLQQLSELLSAYRVVTLTGPGGIGKTRLALAVAHRLCRRTGCDGAIVELVSLSDPGLVASATANALGLAAGREAVSPATVARAIGDRILLLVLDNCEHVIEAAARLAEAIVQACPRATVLATSREPLRIDGECAFSVTALDVPVVDSLTPEEIVEHSAVQLFVERTKASGGFAKPLEERDLANIVTICKRLDGIPLAIELAAARVAALGLGEVVRRLDDRFALLTSGRRTALPRHMTLRAALDWSYQLLPQCEQALLRSLAAFAAGFTLDAVAAITDPSTAGGRSAVDDIASLVNKSLIYLDRTSAEARWRLLESTRAYALEKLRESGEYDTIARRLAQYYAQHLASVDRQPNARPTSEQISLYLQDMDNIRAALGWAFSPQGEIAIGVALTTAAIPLWLSMSLLAECRERVERVMKTLAPDTQLQPLAKLQLHAALGVSLLSTGGLRRETGLVLNETLALATELDDVGYQLQALWAQWTFCFNNGENRAAEAIAKTFLQVAPRASSPEDVFIGERLMGVTMHYRGAQQDARRHLEHVLSLYVAPSDGQHLRRFHYDQGVLARAMLARVLWLQGLGDHALAHARASIEDAQNSGHVLSLCYALAEAACPIALMTGNLAYAEQCVTMLVRLTAKHHLEFWGNWGRCLEGHLIIDGGDVTTGLKVLRSSLDAFRSAGWAMRFPQFLGVLAAGLARAGQITTAVAMIDEALIRCERDGEMWCFAELVRTKGEICLLTDAHVAAAADSFRIAIDSARRQDALFWELRAVLSLARLQRGKGSGNDALAMLRTVYDRFSEGFDSVDLTAARLLLRNDTASYPH